MAISRPEQTKQQTSLFQRGDRVIHHGQSCTISCTVAIKKANGERVYGYHLEDEHGNVRRRDVPEQELAAYVHPDVALLQEADRRGHQLFKDIKAGRVPRWQISFEFCRRMIGIDSKKGPDFYQPVVSKLAEKLGDWDKEDLTVEITDDWDKIDFPVGSSNPLPAAMARAKAEPLTFREGLPMCNQIATLAYYLTPAGPKNGTILLPQIEIGKWLDKPQTVISNAIRSLVKWKILRVVNENYSYKDGKAKVYCFVGKHTQVDPEELYDFLRAKGKISGEYDRETWTETYWKIEEAAGPEALRKMLKFIKENYDDQFRPGLVPITKLATDYDKFIDWRRRLSKNNTEKREMW
ncbi:hypothetical protein AYO44_13330 [Planctomycetaceae bacterium SCGC AG-212-F19]|nr:hypothetical protein AYO44_13330 [Planctomycetaceae bacterium SCGC AG-212-F19]